MNNFGKYLTPAELLEAHPDSEQNLEELTALANAPDGVCLNGCGEDAWKYAGLGMCFTCTTGEADASDDLELIPESKANVECRQSPDGRHHRHQDVELGRGVVFICNYCEK